MRQKIKSLYFCVIFGSRPWHAVSIICQIFSSLQLILDNGNQWHRSVVKHRGHGQSGQACFRRLEKLVLPSIFVTTLSSMMPWNLQSYPATVLNERMRHFRGSKHIMTPPTHFQGSNHPNLQDLRPLMQTRILRMSEDNASRNNRLYDANKICLPPVYFNLLMKTTVDHVTVIHDKKKLYICCLTWLSSIRKLQLQRRNLHWYVQLRRSDYLLFFWQRLKQEGTGIRKVACSENRC